MPGAVAAPGDGAADQFAQLTDFLSSDREDVRLQCAQIIKGLSKDDALHAWVKAHPGLVERLLKLRHDKVEIVHEALGALINLAIADPAGVTAALITDQEALFDVLKMIVFPKAPLADLCSMLLANASKTPELCAQLLEASPGSDSLHLDHLVEVFVRGSEGSWNANARFHFLSNVFANVTARSEAGRTYFRTCPPESALGKHSGRRLTRLVPFIGHPDLYRRGGVISTVKNTCFDPAHHVELLSDDELNLLPAILLPLAGPEELSFDDMDGMPSELQLLEPGKTREADATLRLFLVETVLLFTATRDGREILRARKVYPIMRELDKWESDEKIKDVIFRIVDMLCRDEAAGDSLVHAGDAESAGAVAAAEPDFEVIS